MKLSILSLFVKWQNGVIQPPKVFFDHFSAVGSKWKAATEFASDAQPCEINRQTIGVVSMFINWNKPTVKAKRVDVEIE